MDNFDLRKYLVENKVTTNSRMLSEQENTPTEVAAEVLSQLDAFDIEDIKTAPDMVGESLLDYFNEDPTFDAPEGMFTSELLGQIERIGVAYKKGKKGELEKEATVEALRKALTNPANYTADSKMMNEAEPTFTLNYNTDPDDLKYVESMLSKKGIPAKVSKGTFDDEVEVTVDKKHLKKAKQALEDAGFDV